MIDESPLTLLANYPAAAGLDDDPDVVAFFRALAAQLDAYGVLDDLTGPDGRACAALLVVALRTSDDPAGILRARADAVLTPAGRGPVLDPQASSAALHACADLLDAVMPAE